MLEIDDRIGAVELAPYLPKNLTKVRRLQYADVCWLGNGPDGPIPIGVERKRIGDLISSMEDGRLSGHQLVGMQTRYQVLYLLVEGLWRGDPKTGVLQVFKQRKWVPLKHGTRRYMLRDIANYLSTLTILCGIHVWKSSTIEMSAQWLLATYKWWQKEWKEHKSHLRFATALTPGTAVSLKKPGLVRRIAKELPGVGWERAAELEKHFPTVMDLLMADEGDLRQVAGIGKGLAAQITDALHK